jgi:hypothetical protein
MIYFLFVTSLLWSQLSLGGYKGEINFSDDEITIHKEKILDFVKYGAECLAGFQTEHLDFYANNCLINSDPPICLSKFYGERRYSKKRNDYLSDGTPLEYLGDALIQLGYPESHLDLMQANSCVGMTLKCLRQSFYKTGQELVWRKVLQFTNDNGVGGTALQHSLSQLGWLTYYWNPAPKKSIKKDMLEWDEEEIKWKSKGYHTYRYNSVMNKNTYWYNHVDNKKDLVGFESQEPSLLKDYAFWIGTAHTGYHVFPGNYADVVEAHSSRPITAIDNLEFSKFSPMATGGGPRWTRTEKYRSGLISLPPIKNTTQK